MKFHLTSKILCHLIAVCMCTCVCVCVCVCARARVLMIFMVFSRSNFSDKSI
uniref:Macaca fascicularis brain cDNA, clone: QflA-19887 n=1 Tax=Macaca fascicularis TaxID=9541 RepID=I7GIH5_MACFA|nr:unnamed protein product [Macaca fascicularis]